MAALRGANNQEAGGRRQEQLGSSQQDAQCITGEHHSAAGLIGWLAGWLPSRAVSLGVPSAPALVKLSVRLGLCLLRLLQLRLPLPQLQLQVDAGLGSLQAGRKDEEHMRCVSATCHVGASECHMEHFWELS